MGWAGAVAFFFRFVAWVWQVLSRRPWALVLLGLALLAAAPLYYAGREPICGGRTMEPGDRCRSGSGRVTTYEQEVGEQSWNPWIVGGLGVLALGGGAYATVRKRRSAIGAPQPPKSPAPRGSALAPPPLPPHPPQGAPPRSRPPPD